MKQLLIAFLIILFCASFGFAQDLTQLNNQKTKVALDQIRIMAQIDFLRAEHDKQVDNYVKTKADLQNTLDKLTKQAQALDKKIKAAQNANKKAE